MDIHVKRKYESARANLLVVIIFTALNMLLLLLDSGITFLFSASLPQIFVILGSYIGGIWYLPVVTVIGVILGVLTLGVYVLCYFLSKKKNAWMIVAFIWFVIDWLAMIFSFVALFEVDFGVILDVLFHVWITVYLVTGMKNGKEYCEKELYNKTVTPQAVAQATIEQYENAAEAVPLRVVEPVRGRKTIISAEYKGIKVRIDKVKNMTELVINDFVYGEVKTPIRSTPFTLSAIVNGIQFVALGEARGFYGVREIYAEGALIVQKKLY